MKESTKVAIELSMLLITMTLLISGLFDKKVQDTSITTIDTQITSETTTTNTITQETTKVVETTTKTPIRNQVRPFNIKASKEEMQTYAKKRVIEVWNANEWEAFNQIVIHESNWNANDINKSSGACGLFQMYPCSKTNANYKISYEAQIETGISYIKGRYKTPTKAWGFWKEHKWY